MNKKEGTPRLLLSTESLSTVSSHEHLTTCMPPYHEDKFRKCINDCVVVSSSSPASTSIPSHTVCDWGDILRMGEILDSQREEPEDLVDFSFLCPTLLHSLLTSAYSNIFMKDYPEHKTELNDHWLLQVSILPSAYRHNLLVLNNNSDLEPFLHNPKLCDFPPHIIPPL